MSDSFDKLVTLLKELFQLDQPDLDFGIYRIMRVKSDEVTHFLENDLLPQVKEVFASYQSADRAGLEKALQEAIGQARGLGVDPEATQKVQELRRRLRSEAVDTAAWEADVYDHLYRFFRRYYEDGDFISKRVYKDDVYAIPYQGEEVKLYWANHDQYYVKTSEYFRDYTFRLRPKDDQRPLRVHCRLVDATEGEHDNVRTANKRVFVLARQNFIALEDGPDGPELVIQFEFRPSILEDWPEDLREEALSKARPQPPTQKDLLDFAEQSIMAGSDETLAEWTAELSKPHVAADGKPAEYSRLRAHLNRYTDLNTRDYFIHKDLGAFLRRELDFYIKNEVIHLDDIENETAPRVEQYLSKIKVIRRIAHKLIDFLAQLEDFQKKLWLKKKFVTETSWCVRVGVIPEEFYPEICANDPQRVEWVALHGIDELEGTTGNLLERGSPGYSEPLTPAFLRAHPTLMIDTRHFNGDFTARLLEAIGDIDEQTDGLLVHSENFQALNVLQARYREQVACIYVDPPYNTGQDGFNYKDGYQHSTWLAMMHDRITTMWAFLGSGGRLFNSIDDRENDSLLRMLRETLVDGSYLGTITWEKRTKSQNTKTARRMLQSKVEYIHPFAKSMLRQEFNLEQTGEKAYPLTDARGPYRLHRVEEMSAEGIRGRPTMIYPILGVLPRPNMQWKLGREFMRRKELQGDVQLVDGVPHVRMRPTDEEVGRFRPFWSHFFDKEAYGTAEQGLDVLDRQLGFGKVFSTVKPVPLLTKLFFHATNGGDWILDPFAGSGTTGHAVIDLNREDGGRRKFILVEMADYFDTVLLPRLKKVVFSPEWKGGKPTRTATEEETHRSPRMFKIVRLESYEDALNNLELSRSEDQARLFRREDVRGRDGLWEQYMLRYMLDVETRGSPSLLNMDAFEEPTQYLLKVKMPGSDESRNVAVDLLETFNYLLGLIVHKMSAPRRYGATFVRAEDPDLPATAPRRLLLDGELREDAQGLWWFRTVQGQTRDGRHVLVIWRNRPGGEDPEGVEQDNLMLDQWFQRHIDARAFDVIYVNGTNNLETLKDPHDVWQVRLIEEDFHRLMFEMGEAQ